MTSHPSDRPVSALRARMIEDMRVRGFSEKTRNDYIRNVRAFAAFVGRSPDTATAEDLRRFQHHQAQTGVRPPSINSAVVALRFFFTVMLDRPDLARRLTIVRKPRRRLVSPGMVGPTNDRCRRNLSVGAHTGENHLFTLLCRSEAGEPTAGLIPGPAVPPARGELASPPHCCHHFAAGKTVGRREQLAACRT